MTAIPRTEHKATPQAMLSALAVHDPRITFGVGSHDTPSTDTRMREIMQLKPIPLTELPIPAHECPVVDIKWSKQEKELLDKICTRHSLSQRLCFLEVWGLYLFVQLEDLLRFAPSDKKGEMRQDFLKFFAIGHVSTLMEGEAAAQGEAAPKLNLLERGREKTGITFGCTRAHWAITLEDLQKELKTHLGKKAKSVKTLNSKLQEVHACLELGRRLLTHPQGTQLLTGHSLFVLEKYFPKAPALMQGGPEKTTADLCTFMTFLGEAFTAAHGPLSIRLDGEFEKALQKFAVAKRPLDEIKPLKLALAKTINTLHGAMLEAGEDCRQAMAKTLTHAQYAERRSIVITTPKTCDDLARTRFQDQCQAALMTMFMQNALDILDEQIMHPRFSHYRPTYTCFARFNVNLTHLLRNATGGAVSKPEEFQLKAVPPVALSSAQELQVKTLLMGMQQNLDELLKPLTKNSQTTLIANLALFIFNQKATDMLYGPLLRLVNFVHPPVAMISRLIPIVLTKKLREAHLKEIGAFLQTLPKEELAQNRAKWIEFFQDSCFHASLNLGRAAILLPDLLAFSQLNVDLREMPSDEDLLPDDLVDFIELEGIEQLMDELLGVKPTAEPAVEKGKAEAPIALPASRPAKEKPIHVVTPSDTRPDLAAARAGGGDWAAIRRGEKRRKVLQRYQAHGLVVARVGRHAILSDEDRKAAIAFPTHHAHLKPGTAASIAELASKV